MQLLTTVVRAPLLQKVLFQMFLAYLGEVLEVKFKQLIILKRLEQLLLTIWLSNAPRTT